MRTPKLVVVTCVAVLAVLAAGCGSGSGGSDGAKATTTEARATTTKVAGATTTAASGGAPEAEYIDALITHFTSGRTDDGDLVLTKDQAACVAPGWIDTITLDALGGATPDEVAKPNYAFRDLGLTKAQAQQMIDAFAPCDVDIYALLAAAFTMGLTDEQQSCAQEKVDPKVANALLLTAWSKEAGTGDAEFSALLDQLQGVCDLPAG